MAQIGCPVLKAHSSNLCGPLHNKFAHRCIRINYSISRILLYCRLDTVMLNKMRHQLVHYMNPLLNDIYNIALHCLFLLSIFSFTSAAG